MILLLIILLLILFFIYKNVIIIPPNHVAIVESMGRYSRTLQSGIHVLVPILETLHTVHWSYVNQNKKLVHIRRQILPAKNAQLDIPPIECVTKDSMPLTIDVTIFYDIDNLNTAVYNSQDPLNLFYQCINETIRDQISRTDSEHVLGKDKALSALLVEQINQSMKDLNGLVCKIVRIQSVQIPEDITRRNREMSIYTREHNMEMQKIHYEQVKKKQQYEAEKEMARFQMTVKDI